MDNQLTSAGGALDLVITNVTIVDAMLGVVKADVGVKDGKIVASARRATRARWKASRPALAVGPATDAISGEQLILTAAGIDSHVHYISPQQAYAALTNGITTFFGGGIGPTDGTNGTTITSGPWNIEMMLRASEGLPINVGFLGKGNSHGTRPARRAGRGRRGRLQDPRGLGHDAGSHPGGALRGRRHRRAGLHPHRHAERRRASSKTPSPPSKAARSTPFTPRAPAAVTRPTSSRSPAS